MLLIIVGLGIGLVLAVLLGNFVSGEKHLKRKIGAAYGASDAQFARAMSGLLGPPLIPGNRVEVLINGVEIFPAMLAAIRRAERSITFETFIYWRGEIGSRFAEALAERARHGVRVLVLLDFVGSNKMDPELLALIRSAGAEVERYHPPTWRHLSRINNRTHRKLLIIDGKIGFTGGVGIADEWNGDAEDERHWRDTHFRIEGPAVTQMQAAFMTNWIKTRSTVEHGEEFFPPTKADGPYLAQVFHSSPQEGSEDVRLMYHLSISAARKRIVLEQAYFVPDDLTTELLVAALRRGVAVEIIVPGKRIDHKLVRRASRARWGPLLAAGARIHEYQPTNLHAKMMVVDGVWSSVGSTNFDNRSFRLNDEANLNVLDAGFGAQLEAVFAADRARSREITFAEWQRRPWGEKFRERLAALLRSQL